MLVLLKCNSFFKKKKVSPANLENILLPEALYELKTKCSKQTKAVFISRMEAVQN